MTPPVYLSHPSSLEHETGSHPERAERIVAIERALAERGWLGLERATSAAADMPAITAVHDPHYVEMVQRASREGGARLDADTLISAGSWEAARHGAGGAVELVDRLLTGANRCGFSAHRPPGHHAESRRGMGFCLLNNVAIAAQHALDAHGCERVLVLDWDVHHGNGTNDIFHRSPRVLFTSIHQAPLYPGSGPAADIGAGPGAGYTVNLPVPAGSGDRCFASLVDHVVVALARAYRPELVLISAGYDAHAADPLADCQVTEAGYRAMTAAMRRSCAELETPLGVVLEGGYALGALARSVLGTLEVLTADRVPAQVPTPVDRVAAVARERLAAQGSLPLA